VDRRLSAGYRALAEVELDEGRLAEAEVVLREGIERIGDVPTQTAPPGQSYLPASRGWEPNDGQAAGSRCLRYDDRCRVLGGDRAM
jgi:hypothetical protein